MIKRSVLTILLVGLMLPAGLSNPVNAQAGNPQPIAQFLEISPVKYDFQVTKGTSEKREVTITNKHVSRVTIKASFENLIATDDDGGTSGTDEPTPYDLKRFVTFDTPDEFVLNPRESKKVTVTVTMPPDVAPGGYYGRLRFTPTKRTDLPPVAIQGEIADLFLVRVPGPANEAGKIKDFYITSADAKRAGWFFFGNDMFFLSRVHNDGNVHFSVASRIEAKSVFGYGKFTAQSDQRNVFPRGDRKYEARWEQAKTGIYTAKVHADLPGHPDTVKTIKFLVVTPLFALIALALIAVLAIYLLTRWRRKRRSSGAI